jgi:hypothetical protein
VLVPASTGATLRFDMLLGAFGGPTDVDFVKLALTDPAQTAKVYLI